MPLEEVGDTELRSDEVPHEQLNTLGDIWQEDFQMEQEATTYGHTWTI